MSDPAFSQSLRTDEPEDANSTQSSDCYIEPGQRPDPSQHVDSGSQSQGSANPSPIDYSQLQSQPHSSYNPESDHNEHQANYVAVTDMADQTKFVQLNSHRLGTEYVPSYGKEYIEGPALNIYARILIAQPGDPLTKTLTNPHIAESFRLHIPNQFASPFFRDRQFITHLLNTAKSILEKSFPFPFFEKANLKYILEADSIFFSYKTGQQYFFHRMNIAQLRAMDSELRDEWLANNTPQPSPFICTNGTIFDANYDIVILVHNVRPRQIQNTQNHNEALLLMHINELITEKIDAIGTIAKVLSIYHDYRLSMLKAPARVPQANKERLPPSNPSTSHTAQPKVPTAPLQTVVITPDIRPIPPKVNMLYIPPYRRTMGSTGEEHIDPVRTNSQENDYLHQMEMMRNNYTSPYEDVVMSSQEKKVPKRRARNKLVDPTTPWSRTAEVGTRPNR